MGVQPSETAVQDAFLNQLSKSEKPVFIYLTNGIKLQGHIGCFDEDIILLSNGIDQIVYKHAISTIMPAHFSK